MDFDNAIGHAKDTSYVYQGRIVWALLAIAFILRDIYQEYSHHNNLS